MNWLWLLPVAVVSFNLGVLLMGLLANASRRTLELDQLLVSRGDGQ